MDVELNHKELDSVKFKLSPQQSLQCGVLKFSIVELDQIYGK